MKIFGRRWENRGSQNRIQNGINSFGNISKEF